MLRPFNKIRLSYLDELENDPAARFRIMHNPDHDWDWDAIKDLNFFKIMRPGDKGTGPGFKAPRLYSEQEFRYGRFFLTDGSGYVEVNKRIVPSKHRDTGEVLPYNPGLDSLGPDDAFSIWDINTNTMLFTPNDVDSLTQDRKEKLFNELAKWLDEVGGGNGRIYFGEGEEDDRYEDDGYDDEEDV